MIKIIIQSIKTTVELYQFYNESDNIYFMNHNISINLN